MRGVLVRMRSPAVAISIAAVVLAIAGSAGGTATTRRPSPHRAPGALTIYSLVHRCEALTNTVTRQPIAGSDGPFRMQAAALGTYLLYTPQGRYLTDTGSGALAAQPDPSRAAEWVVTGNARRGFKMTNLATSRADSGPLRLGPRLRHLPGGAG